MVVNSLWEIKEKFDYDEVWPFSEGLAAVRQGKEWFHILPNGYPAYEERYEWVGSFCRGRAEAQENGRELLIGQNGKPIYPERANKAGSANEKNSQTAKQGKNRNVKSNRTSRERSTRPP